MDYFKENQEFTLREAKMNCKTFCRWVGLPDAKLTSLPFGFPSIACQYGWMLGGTDFTTTIDRDHKSHGCHNTASPAWYTEGSFDFRVLSH